MISFHTSRFGTLEVEEDKVINFPYGLVGFANLKRYILMDHRNTPIKWLQAIDHPDVAFLVVEPKTILAEYPIRIDSATRHSLQIEDDDDIAVLLIIRVEEDKIIPNIHGPLVINSRLKIGAQLVLYAENN
jgi:flagellar assembly factor FliW